MLKCLLIPGMFVLSCGSTKTNQSATRTDSIVVTEPVKKTITDSMDNQMVNITTLPACIQSKIDSFKLKEVHEKPQKVVEYKYKGKMVYYVVMPCCDFYNEVYDDNCNFLGAPDGGFTGKGDGKLPDFFAEAKEEKVMWQATH